jgi:single-stranded DNA-binding protein
MAVKTKSAKISTPVQSLITTQVVEEGKVVTGNVGKKEFWKVSKSKTTGNTILKFSVGVNNQETDECTWHNIVCFKGVADRFLAERSEGDLVRITGDLKANHYTSKTDGMPAIYFEIATAKIELVAAKKVSEQEVEEAALTQESHLAQVEVVDNIPF